MSWPSNQWLQLETLPPFSSFSTLFFFLFFSPSLASLTDIAVGTETGSASCPPLSAISSPKTAVDFRDTHSFAVCCDLVDDVDDAVDAFFVSRFAVWI